MLGTSFPDISFVSLISTVFNWATFTLRILKLFCFSSRGKHWALLAHAEWTKLPHLVPLKCYVSFILLNLESHFSQKISQASFWMTLWCLAGVSAFRVAVPSFITACKHQRCHIPVYFFPSYCGEFIRLHPPTPSLSLALSAVAMFHSQCWHKERRAEVWILTACPSPKNSKGSSRRGDSVSPLRQSRISGDLSDPPTVRSSETHAHLFHFSWRCGSKVIQDAANFTNLSRWFWIWDGLIPWGFRRHQLRAQVKH